MKIFFKNCTITIYDKTILTNVTLTIEKGGFYHIAGENGSGKTVLLNTLLGLNKHIEGEHHIAYSKDEVAYIPSTPFFLDSETISSAIQTLCFFYNQSTTTVKDIFTFLQLPANISNSDKIATLSTGMKKKICITPLFFPNLSFFVLDEIFTSLDEHTQNILINHLIALHKQGATIIIVEHNHTIIERLEKQVEMERFLCQIKISK